MYLKLVRECNFLSYLLIGIKTARAFEGLHANPEGNKSKAFLENCEIVIFKSRILINSNKSAYIEVNMSSS